MTLPFPWKWWRLLLLNGFNLSKIFSNIYNNNLDLEKIPAGNENVPSEVISTEEKCCRAQSRIYRKFQTENRNKRAEKWKTSRFYYIPAMAWSANGYYLGTLKRFVIDLSILHRYWRFTLLHSLMELKAFISFFSVKILLDKNQITTGIFSFPIQMFDVWLMWANSAHNFK